MRRIVLTYGLIAGAILAAMLLVNAAFVDRIGFDNGEVVGYTAMVAAFLMIWFGIRTYRDNVAGGTVSFGRAFKVGMLIYLVAASVYAVSWQVISRTLWPDFWEQFSAHEIAKAQREGKAEAEIEALKQDVAKWQGMFRNPLIGFAWGFVEPLPVGLLIALVSAGVLSRRPRDAIAAA